MSRWPKVEEDGNDVDLGVLDLISLAQTKYQRHSKLLDKLLASREGSGRVDGVGHGGRGI